MEHKPGLEEKISTYLDKLFSGVGTTPQLRDLKEELAINIKEKTADLRSGGLDEEQALKEAIISMGDLSGLVNEMKKLAEETAARPEATSVLTAHISTGGIVAGVLLVLFGFFVSLMLFFMEMEALEVVASGIFIVAGAILLTYSILTRETTKRYAMNRIRAALYALSVGLVLFGLYAATVSYFATGEKFIFTASLMWFFLSGVGLGLVLLLTEPGHRKKS